MADTVNNKPKLQLGSGFVRTGPGSPATPTKLLINHGKPNFTIQRSPKMDEQRKFSADVQSNNNNNNNNNNSVKEIPTSNGINNIKNNNNNNNVIKSTKFFGVLNNATKEKTPEINNSASENESSKVMLRRTPTIAPIKKSEEEANVPEFILRQRAIQERLAKENVLDFDKRRSGYFTHVLISPTSNNRTSFAETMSSPAVNPAMEIPAPAVENALQETKEVHEHHDENQVVANNNHNNDNNKAKLNGNELVTINENEQQGKDKEISKEVQVEKVLTNGHVDDEEVANAIEEVNKAIAGEDANIVEVKVMEHDENATDNETSQHVEVKVEHAQEVSHHSVEEVHAQEVKVDVEVPVNNETPKQDGQKIDENNNNDGRDITISHTNGAEGPHIPTADPSGALGVNFEPKTVVSFSKDLGSVENKYPDTVSVDVKEKTAEEVAQDNELKELTKLKFDITTNDKNDINVVPVINIESVPSSS